MTAETSQWVLVFDSGCLRCRSLSRTIQTVCDGRLDTRPLIDPQVRRWAARARPGRPMEWAPTLFHVGETSVGMWTGRSLPLRLLPILGPRGTVQLLRDLRGTHLDNPHRDESVSPGTTAADESSGRRFALPMPPWSLRADTNRADRERPS